MNQRGPTPTTNWKVARRHPRYKLDMRIAVTARRDSGDLLIRGRSSDISEGGLGATLAGDLHPGETVAVEFTLPSARESLTLRATIRYRGGFRYGFEFVGLTAEQREPIARLARSLPRAE